MVIRKRGSKWVLLSKAGKVLGKFSTKGAAEKRERQVRFFKNRK